MVGTVRGDEARAHIDALSRKYTGADYKNPIGPEGRMILVVAPKKVVTPGKVASRRSD